MKEPDVSSLEDQTKEYRTRKREIRKKFPANSLFKLDNVKYLVLAHSSTTFTLLNLNHIREKDFSVQVTFKYTSEMADLMMKESFPEKISKILFYLNSKSKHIQGSIKKFLNE